MVNNLLVTLGWFLEIESSGVFYGRRKELRPIGAQCRRIMTFVPCPFYAVDMRVYTIVLLSFYTPTKMLKMDKMYHTIYMYQLFYLCYFSDSLLAK